MEKVCYRNLDRDSNMVSRVHTLGRSPLCQAPFTQVLMTKYLSICNVARNLSFGCWKFDDYSSLRCFITQLLNAKYLSTDDELDNSSFYVKNLSLSNLRTQVMVVLGVTELKFWSSEFLRLNFRLCTNMRAQVFAIFCHENSSNQHKKRRLLK